MKNASTTTKTAWSSDSKTHREMSLVGLGGRRRRSKIFHTMWRGSGIMGFKMLKTSQRMLRDGPVARKGGSSDLMTMLTIHSIRGEMRRGMRTIDEMIIRRAGADNGWR
jgi:hypothetical protein